VVGGDLKMVGRRPGIWPGTKAPLELVGSARGRRKGGRRRRRCERLRRMDKDATLVPRMAGTWPRRARRRGCSTRGRQDASVGVRGVTGAPSPPAVPALLDLGHAAPSSSAASAATELSRRWCRTRPAWPAGADSTRGRWRGRVQGAREAGMAAGSSGARGRRGR